MCAIETRETFGAFPFLSRYGGCGALAVPGTQAASGAFLFRFLEPEEAETGKEPQQRAQGTQEAAPEPGPDPVHEQGDQEEYANEPSCLVRLGFIPENRRYQLFRPVTEEIQGPDMTIGHGLKQGLHCRTCPGEDRKGHGTKKERDRIHETGEVQSQETTHQEHEKEKILDPLARALLICLDHFGTLEGRPQCARQMVDGAEWTDKTTENTAHQEREKQDPGAPEKTLDESMPRDQ
jgi:hypothetical protein